MRYTDSYVLFNKTKFLKWFNKPIWIGTAYVKTEKHGTIGIPVESIISIGFLVTVSVITASIIVWKIIYG